MTPTLSPAAEVPELLTIPFLSKHWKTSKAVLYQEVRRGNLRAVIVGEKLVRIHPEDAAEYVRERRLTG